MGLPRLRFTVQRLMIVLAVLGVLMGILFPVLGAFDAITHGPYAIWFNRDCQRRADEAGLIGRPEKDVVTVLEPPTFTYEYDDAPGTKTRTYNYATCSYVLTSKFQVHCQEGVVVSLEQFDD